MEIFIDRHKYNFNDYFSFEEFISYTKENCKLIFNFENNLIIEKFKKIYEHLSNVNGIIKKSNYKNIIYNYFNLKDRQQDSKKSLQERGFDEYFIQDYLLNKGKKYSDKYQEKIKSITNKVYSYRNYQISSTSEPKCNVCGSKLIFRFTKNNTFEFIKCSNEHCLTNKFNGHKRFLSITNLEKREIDRKKNILCIEYWIDKGYSIDDAKKIISQEQKKRGKLSKGKHLTKINKEFFEKNMAKKKVK